MRFWWILGLLYIPLLALSQRATQEATVFNSLEIEEVAYDNFSITSGYYTIADNIANRQSSAFISDSPSTDEYIYFAQHQPSYYFLVHQQREVIRMIVLQQQVKNNRSSFFYTIMDPASGSQTKAPSKLGGELTQLRAKELLMSHIDAEARLTDARSLCSFNRVQYTVQPFEAVKKEVLALAQQLLSQDRGQAEELEEYIRAETIGGTLDFSIALAKEPQERFARGGVTYDKHDFSVLLWGGAVRMLGLCSVDSARVLWQEIQQRPLTAPESNALGQGFTEQEQSAYRSYPH